MLLRTYKLRETQNSRICKLIEFLERIFLNKLKLEAQAAQGQEKA